MMSTGEKKQCMEGVNTKHTREILNNEQDKKHKYEGKHYVVTMFKYSVLMADNHIL